MALILSSVEQFFRDYERHTNLGEMEDLVSQFADSFVVAGPTGATAVKATDFALALPKRKSLFDQLGCRSTTLESISETQLDDRYRLVETRWRFAFASGEDVEVGSAFIVYWAGVEWKIVLYLAHQDIMAILKDRGILSLSV